MTPHARICQVHPQRRIRFTKRLDPDRQVPDQERSGRSHTQLKPSVAAQCTQTLVSIPIR